MSNEQASELRKQNIYLVLINRPCLHKGQPGVFITLTESTLEGHWSPFYYITIHSSETNLTD